MGLFKVLFFLIPDKMYVIIYYEITFALIHFLQAEIRRSFAERSGQPLEKHRQDTVRGDLVSRRNRNKNISQFQFALDGIAALCICEHYVFAVGYAHPGKRFPFTAHAPRHHRGGQGDGGEK